jgi:hypothetical protein
MIARGILLQTRTPTTRESEAHERPANGGGDRVFVRAVRRLRGQRPAIVASVDPMQRYFLFYNELSTTIDPVIQAPQASNCGATNDTTLLRIYVNDRKRGAGVPPGGMVRVNVTTGAWTATVRTLSASATGAASPSYAVTVVCAGALVRPSAATT